MKVVVINYRKLNPWQDFKASFLRVPNVKTHLISVFPVIPATIIFSDILFEFNLLCVLCVLCGFISYDLFNEKIGGIQV